MLNPKVRFQYSSVYNENIENWVKRRPWEPKKYPSERKIMNYISKVEKLWAVEEKRILKELSKVTGLNWVESKIDCFVVGRGYPFSHPLTMPIYPKYLNWFIDILIHELIHQLFLQGNNEEKSKKAWAYIYRKYHKEKENVRIHIPLHAIHQHIFLKFFGEGRLQREIRIMSNYKDYKRSWEIVQKTGHEKIIEAFAKRVL